jgi:hypothetical protein
MNLPYETYADKVIEGVPTFPYVSKIGNTVIFEEAWVESMPVRDFRNESEDAFLAGMEHSADLSQKFQSLPLPREKICTPQEIFDLRKLVGLRPVNGRGVVDV